MVLMFNPSIDEVDKTGSGVPIFIYSTAACEGVEGASMASAGGLKDIIAAKATEVADIPKEN